MDEPIGGSWTTPRLLECRSRLPIGAMTCQSASSSIVR